MGGADGSITIDTELDQSGFEQGSDKLLGAVKNLTGAIDTLGSNMMTSFQAMTPLLQSIATNTANIYGTMTSAGQQAAAANSAVTASVQGTAQATQAAAQQTAQTGLSFRQLAQQAQSAGDAVTNAMPSGTFTSQLNAAGRSCDALAGQLQRLDDAARIGLNTDTQVTRFQINVEKARDSVDQLQQKMNALGSQQVPTTEYEQLAAAAQKAEQALFRLYDKRDTMQEMGVKENTAQWKRLEIQIRNAEAELERYESSMTAMQANGSAFLTGGDTAQFQQLQADLQAMTERLSEYEAMAAGFDTISDPAEQSEQALEDVDNELRQKQPDAEQASSALGAFGEMLRTVAGAALHAAAGLARLAITGLAHGLAAAATHAGNLAARLAKMGAGAVATQFKNLVGKVREFTGSGKQATLTANGLVKALTSVKTMLVSRVKRMFISYLMGELKSAMSALIQYSSAFNSAVSGMRNAASGLAGNIGVAFANLVTAIAPAITTIVNLISQAISYLNAFFALLGGKSTVTVAKKQTDDYAKSLGGAAGAAKDLDKANKQLGIDELNVVEPNDDGGGGGGGGGGGASDLFEEVPIDSLLPDDIAAWFDRIKAAFEAGDWYGIGTIISEGLNAAMGVVDDWINNSLRPFATTWASRIAQILNGMVDGLDWNLLGKTVADGLNTAFDAPNTFLTTFNFTALGTGLGNALNGLINNLEWDLMGATLANKWNAVIDTLFGTVSTIDWGTLGTSLATGLQSLFNTIHWDTLAQTIAIGWNGIVTALHNFITGTDWGAMATTLARSINTLARTIDWAEMGKTLSDGIKGAFTFLSKAIQQVDWKALGEDVKTFLVNIDWGGICNAMFEAIGSALGGLAAFISGLIGDAFTGIYDYFSAEIEACGGDIALGILQGIWDALCNIGAWIKTNIFDPFINGFKAAFGIASPSTVMAEQGGFLIEGLLQGITDAWSSIVSFFSTALSSLGTLLSEAWPTIKSTAVNAWNGLKTSVTTTFTNLKTSLTTTAEGIKTTIGEKWESVKTTAQTKWTDIKTKVLELWNGLKTDVGNVDWKSVGSNLVAGVKQGILNAWGTFKSWVTEKFKGIIDSVKSVFGIKSPSRVFAEIGEYLDEGLIVGLKDGAGDMLRTASNLAGDVTDAMSGASPELEIGGVALTGSLSAVADTLTGIARTFTAIADTLAAMGGLQTPAITAGSVVPYQARVSGAGGTTDPVEAINAALTSNNAEVVSVLYEMLERLVAAIEANGGSFFIGDEQIVRSYDRGDAARGIRVNKGAFANVY